MLPNVVIILIQLLKLEATHTLSVAVFESWKKQFTAHYIYNNDKIVHVKYSPFKRKRKEKKRKEKKKRQDKTRQGKARKKK